MPKIVDRAWNLGRKWWCDPQQKWKRKANSLVNLKWSSKTWSNKDLFIKIRTSNKVTTVLVRIFMNKSLERIGTF